MTLPRQYGTRLVVNTKTHSHTADQQKPTIQHALHYSQHHRLPIHCIRSESLSVPYSCAMLPFAQQRTYKGIHPHHPTSCCVVLSPPPPPPPLRLTSMLTSIRHLAHVCLTVQLWGVKSAGTHDSTQAVSLQGLLMPVGACFITKEAGRCCCAYGRGALDHHSKTTNRIELRH